MKYQVPQKLYLAVAQKKNSFLHLFLLFSRPSLIRIPSLLSDFSPALLESVPSKNGQCLPVPGRNIAP